MRDPLPGRRVLARRAAALILAFAVLLVGGCGRDGEGLHPAARAVQELLELRADDVRDAEAYAPYFEESALATALAEGSDEPTGTPRVPRWETPYVSEATTETASVVVVWKASDGFPGWPAVNIFLLSLIEDRWVVVDALEATSAPAPLPSGSR